MHAVAALRSLLHQRSDRPLPAASSRRWKAGCRYEDLEPRLLLSVTDPDLPGKGFNTLEFAPDGRLSQLVEDFAHQPYPLIFRQRDAAGNWSEETVTTSSQAYNAQLLFTADDVPHVLWQSGTTLLHFVRQPDGTWNQLESVPLLSSQSQVSNSIAEFSTALGPNNSLNVVFTAASTNFNVTPATTQNALYFGSNATGTWQFQSVTSLGALEPPNFPGYTPHRFLSLAMDPQGAAHIAYTPDFVLKPAGNFSSDFSQLAYATNKTGPWATTIVESPPTGSGDSGTGSSIAIAPDGTPAIANFYIQRVTTGSAEFAELHYHVRQPNGSWSTQVVTSTPDGYVAGDGPHFTGFAPYLLFDAASRPNIAFSDYASQHFASAQEYAGQIRYAVLSGGQWNLQTVFRQTDPLNQNVKYPALALSAFEIDFHGISRTTATMGGTPTFQLQMAQIVLGQDPSPVLLNRFGGTWYFSEGEAAVSLAPGASVTDSAASFAGGRLLVTPLAGSNSHDLIFLRSLGTGPGQISISGGHVFLGGADLGTVSGGTGSTPLDVEFTTSAATSAAVQAVVRDLAFQTTGPSLSTALRTLRLVIADGAHTSLPSFETASAYARASTASTTRLYRLYNANAGFHHFTTSAAEFNFLVSLGYHDESTNNPGVGLITALINGVEPQHRLYNPNNGQHYLTYKDGERDALVAAGWNYEKDEAFIYTSQVTGTSVVYVLYNDNGGEHLYITDINERNFILANLPSWHEQTPFGFAATLPPNVNSAVRQAASPSSAADRRAAVAPVDLVGGVAPDSTGSKPGDARADATRLAPTDRSPASPADEPATVGWPATDLLFGAMPVLDFLLV